MSSIVEQFGTATVLLFSVQRDTVPPAQKRLRELLEASDIRVYSGIGSHEKDLARLSIAHEIAEYGRPRHERPCTHAAISRSNIAPNSLALIELTPVLIAGYRINEKRMNALSVCLNLWRKTKLIRRSAEEWIESARTNIDGLNLLGIQDESVTNVDSQRLVELEEGYGVKALAETTQLVRAWIAGTSWARQIEGSSTAV